MATPEGLWELQIGICEALIIADTVSDDAQCMGVTEEKVVVACYSVRLTHPIAFVSRRSSELIKANSISFPRVVCPPVLGRWFLGEVVVGSRMRKKAHVFSPAI